MGKHLNVDRWFSVIKTKDGSSYLRGKRVSAKLEIQFPKVYRQIYLNEGLASLVRQIQSDKNCSLAEAWKAIKAMFND